MQSKNTIIDVVALKTGRSKRATAETINAFLSEIQFAMHMGADVRIHGFGDFKVRGRKGYTGRSPVTGDPIQIPARKAIVFRASATLKRAL